MGHSVRHPRSGGPYAAGLWAGRQGGETYAFSAISSAEGIHEPSGAHAGDGITLRKAADAFISQPGLAPTTERTYRQTLALVVAALGPDLRIGELDPVQVQGVLEQWWARQPWLPGTAKLPPCAPSSPIATAVPGLPTPPFRSSAVGNMRTEPGPHDDPGCNAWRACPPRNWP
jgi:hypothetical protein